MIPIKKDRVQYSKYIKIYTKYTFIQLASVIAKIYLCLYIADNLTQVISCHCKGIAVIITELGSTNLCIRHALVMQMANLRRT